MKIGQVLIGLNYTLNHLRYTKIFIKANIKRITKFKLDKVHQLEDDHLNKDELDIANRIRDEEVVDEADANKTFVEQSIESHNL